MDDGIGIRLPEYQSTILSTFHVDTTKGALSIFSNMVSIVVYSRGKVDPALSVVCFWDLCEVVSRPGSQTVFLPAQ